MVKTPRTRHSKSASEPVTIDLAPGEVSRVKAEAEARDEAQAAPQDQTSETVVPPAEQLAADEARSDEPTAEERIQETKSAGDESAHETADISNRPAPERGHGTSALAAGAAGGVIALLLAGGLHLAGLLPLGAAAPQDQGAAVETLQAQIEELRGQVAALEGAGSEDPALVGRIAEAEERVAALAAELETVRTEIAQLGEGAGGGGSVDIAPLEERIAAIEAALAGLDGAGGQVDIGAVEDGIASLREEIGGLREGQAADAARLDTLEQTVAQLGERVDEQAAAPATAIIIAASALKAAIDRGVPFTTELDTYASLAPDATQIEGLRAHAAKGVATRAQLAAEADAAANAMIAAARPVDSDAGIVDRLWASAMGLVQVRPIGMVEGEGVPETVARLDAAVQAGDYERASAEYDTLPEAAKAAGRDFMARLAARHEADRLVDEALAAALRA